MGIFRCSTCDARLDRIVRYCPECGAMFPLAYSFADQDTQPLALVRVRRSLVSRRRALLSLLAALAGSAGIAIVALTSRPTFSAGTSPAPSPSAVSTTAPAPTVDSEAPLSQATPSPTPVSTNTPTASPTATATSTATPEPSLTSTRTPTPTREPPPTSTPGVTADEIVENGGFEEGDRGWHLDGGARVAGIDVQSGHHSLILPAEGGYVDQVAGVVPGARYRLTAWGMLGAAGDTGEIDVYVLDHNGRRIASQEPPVLRFTETDYRHGTLDFTVPVDVTEVRITIRKSSGSGIFAVDDISIRGLVPGSDP